MNAVLTEGVAVGGLRTPAPEALGDCVPECEGEAAEYIRVRGVVQGVGFRPTVWRIARAHGLRGTVANDGEGVLIHARGSSTSLDAFVKALCDGAPPLAVIESVEREGGVALPDCPDFTILSSLSGAIRTTVAADAATCPECLAEILSPFERRFRYPFTNCTHCGPRLSIQQSIPYDRCATTMRAFPMCAACSGEYADPADRRFHAEPIACHACGPRAWLARADGAPIAVDALTTLDDVDATCSLLQRGHIVAVKGLGGFQLACDATNEEVVARLRRLKRRHHKAFALMVRDVDLLKQYCQPNEVELDRLRSAAAPIVVIDKAGPNQVAASVAPGLRTLGFMLPNTPLHHLMLRRMDRPIVLTSGNLSDEPQAIENEDALVRLGGIADYFLLHDRDIARRLDDSVVRLSGGVPRLLRRARGYAPADLKLPDGFEAAPDVLALGGEVKNTFCMTRNGRALLSHHLGDLEDALCYAEMRRELESYRQLFEHHPAAVAIDLHPEYLSSKVGRVLARAQNVHLELVQHHHAHVAACLVETRIPLDSPPVLAVALDGTGWGLDETIWGGEFLLANYRSCERIATFKPVALIGGALAIREPWRNTYAHLMAEMGWARFAMNYSQLDLYRLLAAKPRAILDSMLDRKLGAPLASSCGRLFDAVAAAVGLATECASYEGQAAIEFEALVDPDTLAEETDELAYPFAIPRLRDSHLPYIEPLAMWEALLGDLILSTPVPVIAARFHKGLAIVITRMIEKLHRQQAEAGAGMGDRRIVLTGGVFQNRILFEQLEMRLKAVGFDVISSLQVPSNDAGLALGQAAISAARLTEPRA